MKYVKRYDPQHAPDPEGWLALDEAERTELVLQYHRRARVRLPNVRLHATIHVIVENQVALGDEIPVRRTLERLRAEGLDRHDAVHAVGSVVAKRIYELLKEGLPTGDPNEPYWAELRASLRRVGGMAAEAPMDVLGLDHVDLTVNDLARSIPF